MYLENCCRLCLSKKGEFYKLFCSDEEDVNLAHELMSLLNFQIIKRDQLPESICANCYKIHAFFKEFRSKCSQVNDYINQLYGSEETPFVDITMRMEKFTDFESNSHDDANKSKTLVEEGSASISEDSVAFLNLSYDENLDDLRSNFISGQSLRNDVTNKIILPDNEGFECNGKTQKRMYEDKCESLSRYKDEFTSPEFILSRVKIEMCCDEETEVQVDCPDRMVCSEDSSNHELNVRKDLYSDDCLRMDENIHDYGSHLFSSSALSESCQQINELNKVHSEIPKDVSDVCARRRQHNVPDLEPKPKSLKVPDQNLSHIKNEEIKNYENPVIESENNNSVDQPYLQDQSYLSYSLNNFQSPSMGLTTLYLQMGGNPSMHFAENTEDWNCNLKSERKGRYRRLTNEQRRAHALRQARNRANETPEQRERRRRANAERNALRRANMTPEQLQKSRQEHAQRERERRRRLKDARRNRTALIDRFNKVIKKALETHDDPS